MLHRSMSFWAAWRLIVCLREGFILKTDVMGASSMHVPAWMTGCSFFVV